MNQDTSDITYYEIRTNLTISLHNIVVWHYQPFAKRERERVCVYRIHTAEMQMWVENS